MDEIYKYRTHIGAKEIYAYYCEKTGNPMKLTRKQYTDLFKEVINHFIDLMINNNMHLKFPYRLGTLCIMQRAVKLKLKEDSSLDKRGLAPNWKKCHELWTKLYGAKSLKEWGKIENKPIVYHENKVRLTFYWDKRMCKRGNLFKYSVRVLKPHRQFLSKCYNTNPNLKFNLIV